MGKITQEAKSDEVENGAQKPENSRQDLSAKRDSSHLPDVWRPLQVGGFPSSPSVESGTAIQADIESKPEAETQEIVEPQPVENLRAFDAGFWNDPEENQLPADQLDQLPAVGENAFGQMPRQMPALNLNDLGQMPASADQMPAQMPADDWDVAGLWDLPEENQLPAGGMWAELWRAEKDGRGNYRFALRFVKSRIRKPGGVITPAVERWLARRKGKGRHQSSRDESEQLRGFAEYLAISNRADAGGRVASANGGAAARSGNSLAAGVRVPDVQGVAGESLPNVRSGFIN